MVKKDTRIENQNVQDVLPLTPMQEGMLFYYLRHPDQTQYFEQLILTVSGEFSLEHIERAWGHVIGQNEALRTIFRWEKIKNPVQIILHQIPTPLQSFDLSTLIDSVQEQRLEEIKANDRTIKIDLKEEPFRITAVKLSSETGVLILSNHHILFDGWSTGIILKEFLQVYHTLSVGKTPEFQRKTSLKEYIKWLHSRDSKADQEYWASYLADFSTRTLLPFTSVPEREELRTAQHSFELASEWTERVQQFAARHHLTLATILYTAWGLLLQRYNDTTDVLFGTTVSGRGASIRGLEEMVGLFINTIPLRVKTCVDEPILTLLHEVDQALQQRTAHEHVSLVEIKASSELGPQESLFDSIVVVENYPLDQRFNESKSHLQIQSYSLMESAEFDLTLIIELTDRITLTFSYNVNKFVHPLVQQLARHFYKILRYMLQHPDAKIADIEILSAAEIEQLLSTWNDTSTNYPRNLTIQQVFEEQVEKAPDRTAVVFAEERLTYAELNVRANQLANQLRAQRVCEDSLVGIIAQRSLEMIVGVLAILKAGGAYLPIDPDYPEERIQLMLEDGDVRVLLTQGDIGKEVTFAGTVIDLKKDCYHVNGSHSDEWRTANLSVSNTANSLAYVIYTSGSTGRPKGVMVEHHSVLRLVKNTNYIDFQQDDKILLTGTLAFDASTFEIWGALLNGLELHLGVEDLILRTEALAEYIRQKKIRIMWLTAPLFNVLVDQEPGMFRPLRCLLIGGDALSPKHVNLARRACPELQMINGYGPTENTTFSTYFAIDREYETGIPIGRPISNSTVYILGQGNHLVPIGVYGELCVGGDGLARGYLNRPDLTAEKFITNPLFLSERIYRTGDLARWLPEGVIEFLGRADQQVKIRGFRIELGEIENCLRHYSPVTEVTVVDRNDGNGNKYLCAYVVAEREMAPGELREYLMENLPAYMIPAYFVQLDQLPLNKNGKIDRKALPEPEGTVMTGVVQVAPETELEKQLAAIWQDILNVKQVGVYDNFFELGGHSLKATILASRILKELDVDIPLREIFQRPSIRELAERIQTMGDEVPEQESQPYVTIQPIPECEYYEVSPAQKRMYMLQQFDLQGTAYNITAAFTVDGELDIVRLEQTLVKLLHRHEPLRTSFHMLEERLVQRICSDPVFQLEWIEPTYTEPILRCDPSKVTEREPVSSTEQTGVILGLRSAITGFVRPFALDQAPLFRVGVMKFAEQKYLLVFDLHHIIADGTSMGVLINEFKRFYENDDLEPLSIQYKDVASWQNACVRSGVWKKAEEYWLQRYHDEVPILQLPTDYPRPTLSSYAGESMLFTLELTLTHDLRELARATGSTMYMVLLSGFEILLANYSGQEDLVVGSPVAGRRHADVENVIGMFVNTLAMRAFPASGKTYELFLTEVRDEALQAFENQDYQFEELVEALQIERDPARNPLFDVMFVMQNMEQGEFSLEGLQVSPYAIPQTTAKFDLTLLASEEKDVISLELEYSKTLFARETISRMTGHLSNILREVAANPEIPLGSINMLTVEERDLILYEFNATDAEFPKEATLHTLFERHVAMAPDSVAVVCDEGRLTYRELNHEANRLARALRAKGVTAESVVGIAVERSLLMLVGIFGILKAGGAYLPVNPEHPAERNRYVLEDSQTQMLLTQTEFLSKFNFNGEVLDLADPVNYAADGSDLESVSSTRNLAYIIYTSGSTGYPKGVMIEHRSVVNIITHLQQEYPLREEGTYLLKTAFTFDVSVAELFGWFLGNGRIALLSLEGEKDAATMIQAIERYQVTHINFVPSMLHVFLAGLREEDLSKIQSLQYVFVAGEAFPAELARRCQRRLPGVNVENIYGPTETTIYVTRYATCALTDEEVVPIGKPFPNVKAHIVSKSHTLLPTGIAGELCISGECLARGYLNRDDLTAEKFVQNPFEPGNVMYKTGDLARWLPDGNIEFLGRIDHQVKIRGFRIELGEIENRLLQFGPIDEAIVLAREEQDGDKYLCAYLVSQQRVSTGELREFLLQSLPEYMIPAFFVQLDRFPLNANGKVDRKALPEPGESRPAGQYVAPTNATEAKLADIWSNLLGIDQVGITDHFFELGGHSLKATILAGRIKKEFQVEIPLRVIFQNPTLKGVSDQIRKSVTCCYAEIEKVPAQEYYVTSSAQQRMYMLQQLDPEATVYNIPVILQITGHLEMERVLQAFRELSNRHESLRTFFTTVEDAIVQRIAPEVDLPIEYLEMLGDTPHVGQEYIEEVVQEFVRPFDLAHAPLWRVRVLRYAPSGYLMMFDLHHIISDGTSMVILINEFRQFYEEKFLAELRIQYKDFAVWQNTLLQSEVLQKQESYWLNRFSDEIPVLHLPADSPRPLLQTFAGTQVSTWFDRYLTHALNQLAAQTGSTLNMVLLSALNILLSKYSGQEDVIIGSPVAGRHHADLERIIGMLVNTLALRNRPEGKLTYTDFLRDVRLNILEALDNQDYQFDELVEQLHVERDLSRNPLFDVMFVMQNMEKGKFELQDLQVKLWDYAGKTAKMDITITAGEIDNELVLHWEYRKALFRPETMEQMMTHLRNICQVIVANPQVPLYQIDMLTEEEKVRILYQFNDTAEPYQHTKTLQTLFEEQAERTPERAAIVGEGVELTYRDVNTRANSLARFLREKGVQGESLVALLLDRSPEMMIGILGILKAGGAYLPIVTDYPVDRIQYMLADSQVSLLLTRFNQAEEIGFTGEIFDLANEELYSLEPANLESVSTENNLAYVIYTSGSTGRPKGVMVEQRSVVNILTSLQKEYPIMEMDTYLLKTAYTFDVSVSELFGWFMGGGRLAILPPGEEKDARAMIGAIDRYSVTHINFVPSMLHVFLEGIGEADHRKIQCLQYVFVAGEAFSRELVNRCHTKLPHVRVENIYGPTEATIYVTRYSTECLTDESVVPIGKPFANVRAWIVGKDKELLPPGVVGELCVGGDCLARGYFNRPELTTEKFVSNPFEPEERMYRTGDLARWKQDGTIEYLGRIDHQVKIRGFRIEPGEIENQILRYDPIQECVVAVKEDPAGEKYLCAYLVAEREVTVQELRDVLLQRLPEYMIPAYFVQIAEMPLNANGKIDRKVLPEPGDQRSIGREYVAPRNLLEEALVTVWSEILGISKIGIDDPFFELGGHSLKATLLVARIHQELQVEVPLRIIFQQPTVRGLAGYIDGTVKSLYSSIQPVIEQAFYPVSAAQKRLYIQNQLEGTGISYNMPGAVLLEGQVDQRRIEQVFQQLIRRHETLRTGFVLHDGEVLQQIAAEVEFAIERIKSVGDVQEMLRDFVQPFDLRVPPLLRVGLSELSDGRCVMLFDLHHIIADGVSMENIIKEFGDLYQGLELPALRVQYKDFAVWQNELFASESMEKQRQYWLNTFAGEIPVLNIRTDLPRPPFQSFAGKTLHMEIDEALVAQVRGLVRETGTTPYMIFLSAFNVLLAKYTGQEEMVVGTPIAGRRHADLYPLIGMFVNMLALRNTPQRDLTYREFLQQVKEQTLQAYEHQDYPFEELVETLQLQRNLSRNPLFDVVFSLQDAIRQSVRKFDGLRLCPCQVESGVAKFDLTLEVVVEDERMWLNLEYCTDLFHQSTMERLLGHYLTVIRSITGNTGKKLGEMNILSEVEQRQILLEFNATEMAFPADQTLHQLFAMQVARTPEKIAIIYGEERLTYRQLYLRASRLALHLRKLGIEREELIGIMAWRSSEMLIGIFGILLAGGAYLPLSPDYPAERLQHMLEDSMTRIVLTQGEQMLLQNFGGSRLDLVQFNSDLVESMHVSDIAHRTDSSHLLDTLFRSDSIRLPELENRSKSTDLAYVMYTSGSTGLAKGVMIEHRSVVSLSQYYNERFALKDKHILHMSNVSFDTSIVEIFPPLIYGGTVYIIEKELALDKERFCEYIEHHEIHFAQFVPMVLQLMLTGSERLTSLETVIVGGDVLDDLLKDQILTLGYRLTNHYGPTESTVDAVVAQCEVGKTTIGKPIANTRVYVLDQNLNLAPIGVPGELYIAGIGLARGYLNRPELTAEKFIENPWVPGERIYRTRDLACWQPDGTITFLGRIDQQVKIRGYRIELEEIESQLLTHPAVKTAMVLAREEQNRGKYLCGYVVLADTISTEQLKKYLARKLPEYMIPTYLIPLESMPLTPNGKIDHDALPVPENVLSTDKEYEPPCNPMEIKLIQIWEEVLGVEGIGAWHNFFELGGHSLKAANLVARIHKEFGVEVPLSAIFTYPTIRELSATIATAEEQIYSAIPQTIEQEYYPTSSAQKRLYILNQLEGAGTTYNMPGAIQLEGSFSREQCEAALCKLIERHEALRTSFTMIEGEIVQHILPNVEFAVEYSEAEAKEIAELIQAFLRPFDLSELPLFRVGLFKVAENRYVLVFDLHHIISDGVSMEIILREFMALYQGDVLAPLRIQYKDFAVWQNGLFQQEIMERQEHYWFSRFAGQIPLLNFPTDYPRPPVQSFAGSRISFTIDEVVTGKLKVLAQETNTTLYMILLASYNLLLARYTGQEDIVVGSPVAGRPHVDLENIIGVFINTLAMRNDPVLTKSFKEFLLEVKDNALQAYEHQEYPFEELVERLKGARDLSRNPLFDTMLIVQNMVNQELKIDGLQWKPLEMETGIAKLDLTITAQEVEDKIAFCLEYCTKLFKRTTMERFVEHFTNILRVVYDEQESRLADLDLMSTDEKRQVLLIFNQTEVDFRPRTFQELFEERVVRTPEQIAVMFGEEILTYRELNLRANRLARLLRAKGVTSDTVVGLMFRRSHDLLVGILGIIKAGGAYMPLDPEYPVDRITYILDDSGTQFLLTSENLCNRAVFAGQIFKFEELPLHTGEGTNLPVHNTPGDPIYMIYTSGSTGKPKGVVLEHRGVQNFIHGITQIVDFAEGLTILCLTTVSFDIFVVETLLALTQGVKVVIANEREQLEPAALAERIELAQIDLLQATPSRLGMLLNSGHVRCLNRLKSILIGGEALPESLLREVKRLTKARIYNLYGPTETTVYSVANEQTYEEQVTIGKPVANTQVRILGAYNQLQPIGIAGELCIAGMGLARGYHRRPDLTAEKFVDDPYQAGARMYRTGDLARWLSDGKIEYLGRIDHQVKIRGFRIEPGEIEDRLFQHHAVRECVVVARRVAAETILCAYLVTEEVVSVSEMREHLERELPDYMIPSYFVQLESMPLTPNGKIDRNALPEPGGQVESMTEYVAPTNSEERQLIAVWQKVLGVEGIGVLHNFFALGGHSLKAVQIVSLIQKEMHVQISLQDIFSAPTVQALAKLVRQKETSVSHISPLAEQPYYRLSYNQQRLWILSQREGESEAYNIPGRITVEQEADEAIIHTVLSKLTKRHESLRTRFSLIEGNPVQVIAEVAEIPFEFCDLLDLDVEERGIQREAIFKRLVEEPFTLQESPLVRVAVVRWAESHFDIIFCMHHVISDGWSLEILQREFHQIYAAVRDGMECELPALAIGYKDFAAWQHRWIEDAAQSGKAREYWLDKLRSGFPELRLPEDYPGTVVKERNSAGYRFFLPEGMKDLLRVTAQKHNTSLFIVLTTVLKMFLADLCGQDEIAIGVPSSGRQHEELQNLIGFFVNTIVLINRVNPEATFEQMLEQIHGDTLKALQYQDYPLELVTEELQIKYPKIKVFFNMLNLGQSHLENMENTEAYHIETMAEVKFDIAFYLTEYANGLEIVCTYLASVYKPGTIEYIVHEYIRWIVKIAGCEEEMAGLQQSAVITDAVGMDDDDDDLLILRG